MKLGTHARCPIMEKGSLFWVGEKNSHGKRRNITSYEKSIIPPPKAHDIKHGYPVPYDVGLLGMKQSHCFPVGTVLYCFVGDDILPN